MRRTVPLLILAALGACARPQVAEAPPGPPPGIDGRYRGTERLVNSQSRLCPRSGPRVRLIQNGQVTFNYSVGTRRMVPLTTTVQSDGRIYATDGTGTIEGSLRDGSLEVTITSAQCENHWSMRLTGVGE